MKKRTWGYGILVSSWILGVSFAMSLLAGVHGVAFFPDKSLSPQNNSQNWLMTHVLGEGCKCSQVVYKYLMKRGPLVGEIEESVVILGHMPKELAQLKGRGFKVIEKEARTLASEQAVGVPFLMITSSRGEALYAGGYSSAYVRDTTPILDREILQSLRGGKSVKELPIFGCAVSQRIQSLIDPLQFKYREKTL